MFVLRGLFALERVVALSAGPALLLAVVFPCCSAGEPDTNSTAVLRQVVPLLERVQRDQQAVRESFERWGTLQEEAFDRQTQLLRREQRVFSDRLSASLSVQRDQEIESLLDLGHSFLVIALVVAGVMLFALGAVAWSLLRVLNRIPMRAVALPRSLTGQDEAGLPILPDAQLAGAIEQLEKRLLELGELATRPANTAEQEAPSRTEEKRSLPGDFL